MSYPSIGVEDKTRDYNAIQPSKHFQALTGAELLDIILKQVKDELSQHTEFGVHLTYPKFMYSVKLEIDVFTASVPLTKEVRSAPAVGTEGMEKTRIEKTVGTRTPVDTPDKARADAGLPVSGQKVTEAGVFDVPKPSRLRIL